MRKLAFFTLGMYISIIMSSFVFAASKVQVEKACYGSLLAAGDELNSTTATNLEDGKADETEVEEAAIDYRAYQSNL